MRIDGAQVFILAQGRGVRWSAEDRIRANVADAAELKQLIMVGDEHLLRRSIRLMTEEGYRNITLIANPELWGCAAGLAEAEALPDPGNDILNAIAQLIPRARRAVFFLGDVLFSRNALRKVVRLMEGQHAGCLARCAPSIITTKVAEEVFGFWYDEAFCDEALARTERMLKEGRPGKPWAVPYLSLPDLAAVVAAYNQPNRRLNSIIHLFAHINDYTDDIDSPIEYREFFAPMRNAALVDENP